MTAPQISPFVVDQTRLGGAGSAQRHGFNIMTRPQWKSDAPTAPPPAPPQVSAVAQIAPPPSRLGDLGYGLMSAPDLSKAQVQEIQKEAMPLIEAIRTDLEAIKLESRVLSPESLRDNPDTYKTINDLAPYFTPQEMRNQVIVDTRALQAEAQRALTGAISSYLTDAQVAALNTVVDDSKALVAYVQQFDLTPITGAKSKLSDDEVKARLAEVRSTLKNIEKLVVSGEAGSVPVVEESGMGSVIGTLIAVGILAGIGWYLVEEL